MSNPVDIRIGRHAAKAHRKRVREVANRLAQETDWRGDLARSVKDVIDMDECTQVYGEQHAAE